MLSVSMATRTGLSSFFSFLPLSLLPRKVIRSDLHFKPPFLYAADNCFVAARLGATFLGSSSSRFTLKLRSSSGSNTILDLTDEGREGKFKIAVLEEAEVKLATQTDWHRKPFFVRIFRRDKRK